MQSHPVLQSLEDLKEKTKERHFGEYTYDKDHQCPCFVGQEQGPIQYEPGDGYFCFSKFPNPFTKKWASRYAGLTILAPVLDVLHKSERQMGRPLLVTEWPLVKGVLIQGIQPMKTTAKGLTALYQKVEIWLKSNMIDEVDHRIVKSKTKTQWQSENIQLCERYGLWPWARMNSNGKDWMKLHVMTGTLEMLRRTDEDYMFMPPAYEEPAGVDPESEEKNKNANAVDGAISQLDSVETTAVTEPVRHDLFD
jgi:hypothetical protein